MHQLQGIESLVFVAMVALFLFALIEREARRVVQQSAQVVTGSLAIAHGLEDLYMGPPAGAKKRT